VIVVRPLPAIDESEPFEVVLPPAPTVIVYEVAFVIEIDDSADAPPPELSPVTDER
jgi:hypothetical protein